MASEVGQKLIGLLAPSVGEFLAKAKVTAACTLSDTDLDNVDRSKLAPVADRLEQLLQSLGPEVAKSIKERVLTL